MMVGPPVLLQPCGGGRSRRPDRHRSAGRAEIGFGAIVAGDDLIAAGRGDVSIDRSHVSGSTHLGE